MSCKFLYYVNKAYDIPIEPEEGSNITLTELIADIGLEFKVTFTLATNSTVYVEFSITNGQIEVDSMENTITILILAGDITVPGYYNIKYEYSDNNNKARAIPPCPRRIRFHQQ